MRILRKAGDVPKRSLWQRIKDVALTDVAVREPITRASADIAAQQREILDGTAVGRLTAPEVTQQGVEMFAVCGKEAIQGDTVGKHKVREELMGERYTAQSKRYHKELRGSAMIELR